MICFQHLFDEVGVWPKIQIGVRLKKQSIHFSLANGIDILQSVLSIYFGRKQDIALQKARGTIHRRNHLRLWLTPLHFNNKEVWIGQISRDIGVRFTRKSHNFVTHKIDLDVDEVRNAFIDRYALLTGSKKGGFRKRSRHGT